MVPAPKRRLAIVAILLMAVVAAASIEVALYLNDRPTCDAVRTGAAPLATDRKCFDGSSDRKGLVEALAAAAALFSLGGGLSSWRFLARGGAERQAGVIVSIALLLGGLTILLGSI